MFIFRWVNYIITNVTLRGKKYSEAVRASN